MRQPLFTQHEDGRLTVDAFTDEMLITPEAFRYMDPARVHRVGFREIFIWCDNLMAVYRMETRDKANGVIRCRLLVASVPVHWGGT